MAKQQLNYKLREKLVFCISSYFYDSKFNFKVLQKVILYSPPFAFLSTIRLVNHSLVSSLVPFASSITTRGLKLGSTVSKKDQLSDIFRELAKYKTKTKKVLKKSGINQKTTKLYYSELRMSVLSKVAGAH